MPVMIRVWQGWKKKLWIILPGVLLSGFFYAYNMGLFRHEIQFATLLDDVSEMTHETQGVGRWHYLCTQFNVISIYIRLLLIPIHQILDYPYPFKNGFFDGATPYAFLFLAGIVHCRMADAEKQIRLFLSGFCGFLLHCLLNPAFSPYGMPCLNIGLYLPMFGFSLILAYGCNRLLSKHRRWVYGGTVLILAALSISTYHRNAIWRDGVLLWSDVVMKTPSNYRALTNLGIAFEDRGDFKAALANYDAAIRLNPEYFVVLYNKGVLLGKLGKTEEAIPLFHEALRIKPKYSKALVNLGVAVVRRGDPDKAVAYLQKALAIQPESLEAHLNLATIFANTGKPEPAVEHYLKALSLDPDNAKTHSKVAVVLHVLSRYDEAAYHYREAIRLDPTSAETYLNQGNLQSSLNMLNDAVLSYKESIRLNPKSVEGLTDLGVVFMRIGDKEEAENQFHAVLKINPDSVEARTNLGNALYSQGKMAEALQQFGVVLRLKPNSKEILDMINSIIRSKTHKQKEPDNTPDPHHRGAIQNR